MYYIKNINKQKLNLLKVTHEYNLKAVIRIYHNS